jgi:transposase
MSRELRADYTKQFLFPPCVEDWVKAEDPARFVRSFVDQLDLREIAGEEWAEATEDPNGRPHYAFDLLLKAWLYGYLYNIRSCRKLERACRQMMPLVWLTGEDREAGTGDCRGQRWQQRDRRSLAKQTAG